MQESKMPLRCFWGRVELGVLRSKILARDFFESSGTKCRFDSGTPFKPAFSHEYCSGKVVQQSRHDFDPIPKPHRTIGLVVPPEGHEHLLEIT